MRRLLDEATRGIELEDLRRSGLRVDHVSAVLFLEFLACFQGQNVGDLLVECVVTLLGKSVDLVDDERLKLLF